MRYALALVLLCGLALPAHAGLSEAQLASVGITPPPNARIPLALPFRDATGRPLTLGDALDGRPTVLLLADYTCQTLCGAATTVTASELEALTLRPGLDYSAAVVGIDPKDGPAQAAAAKAGELADYPKAAAAMRFLVGDQAAVDRLTQALGYRYAYDAEHDQFAHPAGLIVVAADGRVARVLAGMTAAPSDLRLALVEAGEGRVGTLADQVRLLCYGYDAARGIYTPLITRLLEAGAVLTLLAIAGFVLLLRRRERRVAAADGAL